MITKNASTDGGVYHCIVEGCNAETTSPFSDNPRERWIVGICLTLDEEAQTELNYSERIKFAGGDTPEEKKFLANICPKCALQFMGLNEEVYQAITKTEDYVTDYIRKVQPN